MQAYLGTHIDVLCYGAVGEGELEVVGVDTGDMWDH